MPVAGFTDPDQVVLNDEVPVAGIYRDQHDMVNYVNPSAVNTILPGEPILFMERVMISKEPIFPASVGTLCAGCIVDVVLDPALVGNIDQGEQVYWSTALADADAPSGRATNVAPTAGNGFSLGYAVVIPNTYENVVFDAGTPVAAQAGDAFVRVWCHSAPVTAL